MWASDLGFDILGLRTRLQSQENSLASEIAKLWSSWHRKSTAARLKNTFSIVDTGDALELYRDCARVISTTDGAALIIRLLVEANRHILSAYGGFAAHSAVVGSPHRVAAVMGESGVGKTTLAASATLAGLDYGSDEALCVNRSTGLIVPYPRPMGLSTHSQKLLRLEADLKYNTTDEAPITVDDLGGSTLEPGRHLTDIVLPVRTDRGDPLFEKLSPADGAAALLSNSFNHFRDPHGSYTLTAALAAETQVWRFSYSDALASGRALAEHLHSSL